MPELDLDLHRALAPLLEKPLAQPEPLPELERRAGRARRRRWATRVGAGMTVALLAVVAVTLLPGSADQVVRTTPPADAPSELRPPAEPFLPSNPLRDGRTIHRGSLGGEKWQLLIGFDAEGRPCVALRQELGERRLCGNDFYPWRPYEEASASIGGIELRFGDAAPSVARIRLGLDDGAFIDATILEPAPRFPNKVWFAAIPEGTRVQVVAPLDANGLPAGG